MIILKHIPRYDLLSSSPPGLKASLSKLFNETLDQLLFSSAFKDRVMIGNHNLDCSGGVLQARYRNIQSQQFDGIHMYGPSGQKAYTASVINILSSAQLVQVNPPKYYEEYDHQSCKQTRYQAKMKMKTRRPVQNKSNTADSYLGNSTQYTVPTSNRFAQLGDFFPKN
jgi:hypothetical protein